MKLLIIYKVYSNRTGHVRFFVQYLQATIVLSQKLDTRNQPQIKDLQFEMGNIQVYSFIHQFDVRNSIKIHSDSGEE